MPGGSWQAQPTADRAKPTLCCATFHLPRPTCCFLPLLSPASQIPGTCGHQEGLGKNRRAKRRVGFIQKSIHTLGEIPHAGARVLRELHGVESSRS